MEALSERANRPHEKLFHHYQPKEDLVTSKDGHLTRLVPYVRAPQAADQSLVAGWCDDTYRSAKQIINMPFPQITTHLNYVLS